MSTAVLEIAEKAQKLTREEWDELMEMLENQEILTACEEGYQDFLAGRVLTAEQLLESVLGKK